MNGRRRAAAAVGECTTTRSIPNESCTPTTTEYRVVQFSISDTSIDTPNGFPLPYPKGKGKGASAQQPKLRPFRDRKGNISPTPARPVRGRSPMLLKVRSKWEWSTDHDHDVPPSQSLAHKSARRITWGVCETTLVPSAELGRNAMAAASRRTMSRGVMTPGKSAGPPLREAEHSTPDCWIADTGCGHDLLASKWVSECDKNKLLSSGSCLLYTSPSPRDGLLSRMPSSA